MRSRIDDILASTKLDQYIKKKEEPKKANVFLIVLAVIGVIAVIAAIAYAVYYFLTPDYVEDYEDDFDDDFDDDFFNNEEDDQE